MLRSFSIKSAKSPLEDGAFGSGPLLGLAGCGCEGLFPEVDFSSDLGGRLGTGASFCSELLLFGIEFNPPLPSLPLLELLFLSELGCFPFENCSASSFALRIKSGLESALEIKSGGIASKLSDDNPSGKLPSNCFIASLSDWTSESDNRGELVSFDSSLLSIRPRNCDNSFACSSGWSG